MAAFALFTKYTTKCGQLLAERPATANLITGASLGLVGDIICQKWLEGVSNDKFDVRRSFSMICFGGFYGGGVSFRLYNLYPKILPSWFMKTPLREGVASSLIDNFLHVPFLYTPAFFLTTGLLQGATLDDSVTTMRSGFWPSIMACWVMWIPLQAFNFSIVPRHLRCALMNGGCVVWNVMIDFISNSHKFDSNAKVKEALDAHVRAIPIHKTPNVPVQYKSKEHPGKNA